MRLWCLAIVLFASAAQAQVFSPGALSRAHASLEGLGSCTKCHAEGNKHDNTKCLDCHKEIGKRVNLGAGYHATVKSQQCAECHREHRGVNAKIVQWGPAGRDAFNHNLTGWPLKDAHKKPECRNCHEPRRITDNEIMALVVKNDRESYLGLSERCVTCHFDEHRGQEGKECAQCHTPTEFKRAPGFNHNNRRQAKFPLIGRHKKVECKECHEPLVDTKTPKDAFPEPRAREYLQLDDIPHEQCVACHEDVHRGSFGKSCDRCHTPVSWRSIIEGAQDTGFHDKHRFKLRGEHQSVTCKRCHGPFPGQPAKFRGLKFARCNDCHFDAHVGQIRMEDEGLKCESCHSVNGFVPVSFDVGRHEQTRFALEGAHRTVACNRCHTPDERVPKRLSSSVRADVQRKGRRLLVSAAAFKLPDAVGDAPTVDKSKDPADCEACHTDVHQGQFWKPAGRAPGPVVDKKTCATCHGFTSFQQTKLNHDDTRFPLTGKHKDVACASCHVEGRVNGDKAVLYRPMSLACASCHDDVHVGQLAKKGGTDCASCHATSGFKPAKFDHDKQSVFPLVGRHEKAKCEACHAVVEAKGAQIARYKPLPAQCVRCHEDEHEGAFDDFDPLRAPPSTPQFVRRAVSAGKKGNPDARCDGCHTPVDWVPAKFAHERVGFALTGKHAIAPCASCHGSDFKRPLPPTCAACHVDPHAQEFGLNCGACHGTDAFTGPPFPVDAHRRTRFPLSGRHAALPCDECHVEKRESTFSRAALDCRDCHARDAQLAGVISVEHTVPPFSSSSCSTCHVPAAFSPATFAQHDACFPISRGVHAPFACRECHVGLAGSRSDGSCKGPPVTCAECHTHSVLVEARHHLGVSGYEHRSEKCAGCHRAL